MAKKLIGAFAIFALIVALPGLLFYGMLIAGLDHNSEGSQAHLWFDILSVPLIPVLVVMIIWRILSKRTKARVNRERDEEIFASLKDRLEAASFRAEAEKQQGHLVNK